MVNFPIEMKVRSSPKCTKRDDSRADSQNATLVGTDRQTSMLITFLMSIFKGSASESFFFSFCYIYIL